MSIKVPTPPVPDLARVEGDTVDQVVEWLTEFFEAEGCPWNYRSGTKAIKAGYKGLHRLDLLLAGCQKEKTKQGKISNSEIVRLGAPLSFGRATQVFDLPPRKFAFGRDRKAAYRIPFFFVEDGVIKLYYVQPRKKHGPNLDQMCMIATIHKRYLLDTEFFGQRTDVEYVNLSVLEEKGPRVCRKYTLGRLDLWSDARLADRLTLISEALDKIEKNELVTSRRRIVRPPEPEMPLFD
jgi:hypothetical protein